MKKYVYLIIVVIALVVLTGCPKQIVNQPPTVSKITTLSEIVTNNSITFNWSGNDTDGTIMDYEYRKDGGDWMGNATSTSYTWSDYAEGIHIFEVRAKDNAGAYSEIISWNFDYNKPPTIAKVEGPDGTIWVISSTFSWSGNDTNTIYGYEYRKDNGAWVNNGIYTSYTWSDYTEGSHIFEIRARDNEDAYSDVISWIFNYTSQPTVTIVNGPDGTISDSSSMFSWNGTDTDGTITDYEYRKEGGDWTGNATSTSYTWSDYSEGSHTFEVKAKDNEGVYSEIIKWTFNYVKPNVAPTVARVSGTEGNTNQSINTFTWSGSDADGTITDYEYRKDSGTWMSNGTNTIYTWRYYTGESHLFEVRAKDNEGAYSEVISWYFTCEPIIETALIEAGTFDMGDEFGDLEDRCGPVHEVTFTYDFELGKYEMTNQQYAEFLNDRGISADGIYNDRTLIAINDDCCQIGHDGTEFYVKNNLENYPVIEVSWWGAIEYCNWLSERNGCAKAYDVNGELLDSSGVITTDVALIEGYRLPTEAEWEYAARGGKYDNIYPYLEFKYSGSGNPDVVAWYYDNSANPDNPMYEGKGTHETGMKESVFYYYHLYHPYDLPCNLELYDMSGNVWEWCGDYYYSRYYSESPSTNPYCYENTSSQPNLYQVRVTRGGCWNMEVIYTRVAKRNYSESAYTDFNLGFRLCRTVN